VVSIAGLRGEAASNAVMKAVTKAKRRVTLSICGLRFLDETEVEDIPDVVHEDMTLPAPKPATAPEKKIPSSDDYVERWTIFLEDAVSADELIAKWKGEADLRRKIDWPDPAEATRLALQISKRVEELKKENQPDLITRRHQAEES